MQKFPMVHTSLMLIGTVKKESVWVNLYYRLYLQNIYASTRISIVLNIDNPLSQGLMSLPHLTIVISSSISYPCVIDKLVRLLFVYASSLFITSQWSSSARLQNIRSSIAM